MNFIQRILFPTKKGFVIKEAEFSDIAIDAMNALHKEIFPKLPAEMHGELMQTTQNAVNALLHTRVPGLKVASELKNVRKDFQALSSHACFEHDDKVTAAMRMEKAMRIIQDTIDNALGPAPDIAINTL